MLSALSFARTANAQDVLSPEEVLTEDRKLPQLVWKESWNTVGAVDYVVIGIGGSMALAAALIQPIHKKPSITVGFDESVRDSISQGSTQSRYRARDTSDVTLSLLVTWPLFIDALVTGYWYREAPEVAYNMALIDAEAIAITAGIQGLTNTLVSRERPYGRDCGGSLSNDLYDCDGSKRYRSFFSGHSSLAFTGAGLICTHHLKLELIGDAFADAASCGIALGAAATTATLRVLGDVHYATDVITGSLFGLAVGVLVPMLHYSFGDEDEEGAAANPGTFKMSVVPFGAGVGLVGSY